MKVQVLTFNWLMQLIVEQLLNKQVFKDASLRNIQAHIVASLITHQFREHE